MKKNPIKKAVKSKHILKYLEDEEYFICKSYIDT